MLKIFSISLGCPKNRVDSERVLGSLGPLRVVQQPGRADLVFINTCGFILPAVEESVQVIVQAVKRRERLKRRPLLVVAGCLVGRYGAASLAGELPEVDLWLDNHELEDWPALLARALGLVEPPAGRLLSTGPAYAWLKISEGCEHKCAFCTIPAIRGPLRSLSAGDLLREARELLDAGVRELVLVAQDVTAWGRDTGQKDALLPLLADLQKLPGLSWLRLLYLYPAGLSRNLLDFMREACASGPLLPYFDVPVQHAHPEILSRMGRPFARDPRRVFDAVREKIPEAALRTSLIAGFPGESEEHFASLENFVRDLRFNQLGVFCYQPEEGTRAASLPGQVPEALKEERRERLMRLQAEISAEKLAELQGQVMSVLVDASQPDWPGLHRGRIWSQAPEIDGICYVSGDGVQPGALVQAEIVESHDYDLSALV